MTTMTSALAASVILAIVVAGCRGSEETTENATPPAPTVTDLLTRELAAAKASNDSLKLRLMKVEEANRAAAARAAQLEAERATVPPPPSQPPPPPPPRETQPVISNLRDGYARALNLFRSANYTEGRAMFQAVLDAGAPVEMQDNCYYWMGECAYGEKKYDEAIELFRKIFTFAKSEKKDESQIMIANSYLAMGNKPKAKAEYERLVTKFPASPYVKKAKARLAAL
jgi:TolA-binding protein